MNSKIDEIVVADDRRRVDEPKVRELAESIQKVGLLNPITVTPEKKLVAGAHRLEACLLLGWNEIECQDDPRRRTAATACRNRRESGSERPRPDLRR